MQRWKEWGDVRQRGGEEICIVSKSRKRQLWARGVMYVTKPMVQFEKQMKEKQYLMSGAPPWRCEASTAYKERPREGGRHR